MKLYLLIIIASFVVTLWENSNAEHSRIGLKFVPASDFLMNEHEKLVIKPEKYDCI